MLTLGHRGKTMEHRKVKVKLRIGREIEAPVPDC